MHQMPVPCTNCVRFHYGVCRERPKQCFKCGDFNHIVRYCPYNRHIQVNPGEPLLGTRGWCNKYGLDNDPELKWKILDTFKASPGCAIWLNNVCIYGAKQQYFSSDYMQRGRSQDNYTTRHRTQSQLGKYQRRSRSPVQRRRSRSPSQRGRSSKADQFGYDITPRLERKTSSSRQRQRFRSRSPLRRRSPSSNRLFNFRLPSPRCSRDSPLLNYDDDDNSQRNSGQETKSQNPQSWSASQQLTRPPLFSFEPESSVPLSNITNACNTSGTTRDELIKAPSMPPTSNENIHDLSTAPLKEAPVEDLHVHDPHFILGVMAGAGEQEVCDAYVEKMSELETERMEYENNKPEGATKMPDVFQMSIKMLDAARKQIIGH